MFKRNRMVRLCAWLAVLGLVWATLPVLGGMAELGKKRKNKLEALAVFSEDLAAGDGKVTLSADGLRTFSHATSPGEPLGLILQNLVDQMNAADIALIAAPETDNICVDGFHDSQACVLNDPLDPCVTVGVCVGGTEDENSCVPGNALDPCIVGGGVCVPGECVAFVTGLDVRRTSGPDREVSELSLASSDSAFGFVKLLRQAGLVSARAVTDSPAGDGVVEIVVNGLDARAATVSTASYVGDATGLNLALVDALEAQGFAAGLTSQSILISQDILTGKGAFSVDWEDTDTGIVNISGSTAVDAIPTLSELGLVLLVLMLGGGALLVLRRRGRPAQT